MLLALVKGNFVSLRPNSKKVQKMKKIALMLMCCLAVVCLVSCNKKPSVVGNWKEVRSSILSDTIGFSINKDGSMECFNTGYIRYEKWSQNENELELQGVIVGGDAFDEKMTITKLTEDTLQFKDSGGYESTYVRIPAAPSTVVGLGEMNK